MIRESDVIKNTPELVFFGIFFDYFGDGGGVALGTFFKLLLTQLSNITFYYKVDYGKDPLTGKCGYPLKNVLFFNPKQPGLDPFVVSPCRRITREVFFNCLFFFSFFFFYYLLASRNLRHLFFSFFFRCCCCCCCCFLFVFSSELQCYTIPEKLIGELNLPKSWEECKFWIYVRDPKLKPLVEK
jgi:hypothetical protein